MNLNQISLVQDSFSKVAPIAGVAAEMFYRRLFELDPKLKSLFRGDINEQGKKLMTMLAAAVRGLDHVEKLVPVLQSLGVRHAGYGVQSKDYDTVGAAFLWTLEQGLGKAFTADVHDAWAAVYGVIAETMIAAAAPVKNAAHNEPSPA